MYDGPRDSGHRYVYRDLLGGHLWTFFDRRALDTLGGFDSTLAATRAKELEYRVIASGMRLRFVPDAIAWHHERTELTKVPRRKYGEDIADVQLLRRDPERRDLLPLSLPLPHKPGGRLLLRLAWERPTLGDSAATYLGRCSSRTNPCGCVFAGLLETLIDYWYWRGVAPTRDRL